MNYKTTIFSAIFYVCCALVSTNLSASSANSKLKEGTIMLVATDMTLNSLFENIEEQTAYKFSLGEEIINNKKRYEISYKAWSLKAVLKDISKRANLEYKIEESIVLVRPNHDFELANSNPQFIVNGTVTDNSGMPIPGANVLEKGTSNGVFTDFDGKFSLNLTTSNPELEVSYIGFSTKTVLVDNKEILNIQLSDDNNSLDEVVIIGYGEQARTKNVGAVGQIKQEELSKVASSSFEGQIAGKMSGVIVNQSNGQPGASSQIVIRGTGTLTAGTNPLIVVDGYPLTEGSSLNDLNPDDIANINVLKDAASASIYGSRAANGVILVTTKKGNKKSETVFSLDVYGGIQEKSTEYELVDAYDFAQYITEARNWGYVSKDPANRSETDPNSVRVNKKFNGQGIDGRELYLDFLQPYLDGQEGLVNTDWMDVAFRTAEISNYNLSASGGNEKTKFYTSLGFFDQEGIVIGTDLKRYSFATNLETQITDKIKIGTNIKASFTDQNQLDQSSRSSGALALSSLNLPYYSPYTADGALNISDQIINEQREIEGVRINGTPVENLLATARNVKDNRVNFRTFGNIFLEAELLKNLKYKLSLGGDYDNYNRNFYYPSDVGSYRTPAPRSDAEASQTKRSRVNYIIENTLIYDNTFKKHHVNVLGGYTFQKENINTTVVNGTGFADNNIRNIAGASANTANYDHGIWALESYFGRLLYDYDSKYLFSAAIRRDGSSRFGVNNRWGNFPSLSGGWIFSKEDFLSSQDVLTFGKLSASWGKTGNNQIGNYGSHALVTESNYVYGSSLAPGYITTSSPNPDLGWEIASSANYGIELGFFNKLNLSAAFYKTNTKDLLLEVPVPQQTGYTTVLANIGEMENKGFEFDLNLYNLKIGEVKIGVNANMTTYENKVLALGPGQDQIATGRDQLFITKVGGSIAEIYGYDIDGIYKTQEEINNSPHLSGTLTGDYIVRDVNNDGVINGDDKISKGTYTPDFTYGFGSNIAYNGFNFSFNFTGVSGRTLMDGDLASLTESGEGFGVPTKYYFENRYHPVNNPNGFLGQPNFGNFSNSRKILRSSIVVKENNGDYIRLRDVRLAYNVQPKLLSQLSLKSLQVYVSGNNVFTKTDYRGWNPDGTSSDVLTSGYNDGSNYPVAKTFLMGLKISY
ncbi:SusC/RagA family TonB-linked outer membrane protein [Zunongwangia profunda]|uniref:SusC/RagA family TonB-linked outer membrane protein n=1 Tax=Zunongwangia profunda TaxID=398743 RepID=UPI00248E09F8|nr:TonB-dependent receptor [Zunongwangia profunda]|tara:strand:- start:7412 stop:10870 length:3459 start_codon:yes stop_codon:yes gene_type:complete